MKKVKICGVPEHFNLPWHMAIEEGIFEGQGIDLRWEAVPEGTGRMANMLATGEVDLAIILTEGIVRSIADGNPSAIVQTYISSPLLWGIHVAATNPITSLEELEGKVAAISRFGSGSHLMAVVHAQERGWALDELQFKVVDNLEGAVMALSSGLADYFMWEHFTTKPIVDQGTFKRLGDFPTPWPCFVIAANQYFLAQNPSLTTTVLQLINDYTKEFRSIPSIDRTLANVYSQELEDIQKWLSLTRWSQQMLTIEDLDRVVLQLRQLGLITENETFPEFLWKG
ncbi:MAG: substrate-binding domain-containing protein [Bacteroidota bacterium]